MTGKLYLVGTPIGNLGDITMRALETLKKADVIACEDTRHTLALLTKFEIKKPLISYYKQKEKEGAEGITELLNAGKNVALVTDAGMPCISDPGSFLVKYLYEQGYEYSVVPGATAVTSAAALNGCEKGFLFLGFLPEKNKEKEKTAKEIANAQRSVILYSAPHDVNKTLDWLYERIGERDVALIKEITKIFENVKKGKLSELREDNPKGEYVIIVEPKECEETITEADAEKILRDKIAAGTDKKTAVAETVAETGFPKNLLYKISLKI